MGPKILIYILLYALTLGGAITVLLAKDTVKSAMALVLVMISLAMNYFVMGQEFVGAIQILIYAGAIMVIFLFVIMLLNVREREVAPWYLRNARVIGATCAGIFVAITLAVVIAFAGGPQGAEGELLLNTARPSILDLTTLLITKYSLPFVLTSILLLVAVIGAVVMGRRLDPETHEEYIATEEELA